VDPIGASDMAEDRASDEPSEHVAPGHVGAGGQQRAAASARDGYPGVDLFPRFGLPPAARLTPAAPAS